MIYAGQVFTVDVDEGVLNLRFDSQADKVNVFNKPALAELEAALESVVQQSNVRGLVLTSGKSGFIAGADITEFLEYFNDSDAELRAMLERVNGMFNRLEDLPFPTVAAVNGVAQGGGFEVCLACDFRVLGPDARVGLPEVKLGIMPGWGGSVRLPRLIGVDNAVEWMCTGSSKRPDEALKEGAADAVVPADRLLDAARRIFDECEAGRLDIDARRRLKKDPLSLSDLERSMAIESARGVVGAKAGPHYPAPLTIIATIEAHAAEARDDALPLESDSFIKLAKTEVAESLVGIFLKDQALKRIAREHSATARPVHKAAVLGAGIMGGGVAWQSASTGTPIVMKDIRQEALDAGLAEAGKLLSAQVKRGRLSAEAVPGVLNAIQPALSYGEFGTVDLVVEAVVENADVKRAVLAEVEAEVDDSTILTTNTSTISVNLLASALVRPENFCGMHFFNPVHRMPLVEVIRAESSSEEAIATTVAYAQSMNKTPIVVNDCPGFLVNRILFAYFGGFSRLVADGGDIQAIDKTMEAFGWPMGPAYLLDVVGIDTGHHAASVMAEGFPERMASEKPTVIDAMYEAERYGQKNGVGFYRYEADRKGRPKKLKDPAATEIIARVQAEPRDFDADTIVERLMIPLCIEAARCVEEHIVGSAAEADMGLVYGVGFPPFRGGALHYMDRMGISTFCKRADALSELGPLYEPTQTLRRMAANGKGFYAGVTARTGESA